MIRRRKVDPMKRHAAVLVALAITCVSCASGPTHYGFQLDVRSAPPPPRVVIVDEPDFLVVGSGVYVVSNAGPDQTRCTEGAETLFALNGSAANGIQPIASTTWSVVSGDAIIESPGSPVTTARVSSATATLRLTAVQINGCTKSDDVILSVQQPPVCSITGVTSTCPRATNTFTAPAGMTTAASPEKVTREK